MNYILLLLMLNGLLYSEDFTYHFNFNTKTPYKKEAILLNLELTQTNKDIVLMFDFDIQPSEEYTFRRLNIQEQDKYHNAQVHYTYLLYPLHSGLINIQFKLTKKITTDESIAYSFSGDRDNVKTLVTKDTKVLLPPIQIDVKPLPLGTQIVGDFNLTFKESLTDPQPYEPSAFSFTIKGHGYTPIINKIFTKKEVPFTIFKEKPIVTSFETTKGTESTVQFLMALSHQDHFIRPSIEIKAFNPKTKHAYTLKIPKRAYNIKAIHPNQLLDTQNTPLAKNYDYSWIKTLFSYLIVFFAGYLTSLSLKWHKKTNKQDINTLHQKIKDSHTKRDLLQLLIATDTKLYKKSIQSLEASLYKNSKINFNQLKDTLCKTLF